MTDVEVTVDETPAQETSPSVVVVESASDAVSTEVAIDLTERVTRLEMRLDEIESRSYTAASVAEQAAETADIALDAAQVATSIAIDAETTAEEVAEIAVETADETGVLPDVLEAVAPEEVAQDVTPRKRHPLFRSLDEWKSRISE